MAQNVSLVLLHPLYRPDLTSVHQLQTLKGEIFGSITDFVAETEMC